jgi:hypothetical protein
MHGPHNIVQCVARRTYGYRPRASWLESIVNGKANRVRRNDVLDERSVAYQRARLCDVGGVNLLAQLAQTLRQNDVI